MTRDRTVPSEKPAFWVGSAKGDLLTFPEAVKDDLGIALSIAQFGGKHPKAKPWKGQAAGVFEIVAEYGGDAFRTVYTVRFEPAVYVLHAFQKKSPTGVRTAKGDVALVAQRLRMAREDYEVRYGKD